MIDKQKYQPVIGLEVHARLITQTKLFCADANEYGSGPNQHISPITLGYPGTLPRLNKKAVEQAVKLGIACNCTINQKNFFARKHYFYPDLPKGFQTTQHTEPVCLGGYIPIKTSDGIKQIPLHHIHMEDDAGKSIHDADDVYSLVDYNRAGTPLVEIVTMPAMHSAEEAGQFVTELRKLVKWIDVCDGNMEEGSLRCDANISIRLHGEEKLGTRVEVKNLNSIRNVKKAIEYEIERMIDIVERGDAVQQQTRSFDADTDTTFALREKEEANDYRYFPEPDLPPVILSDEYLDEIKRSMPALPAALSVRMKDEYGLNENDASQICAEKETAEYFLALIKHTNDYKAAANWLNGPLRQYANENKILINDIKISAEEIAGIIEMIEKGMINFSAAAQKLFPALLNNPGKLSPQQMAESLNMLQVNDTAELEQWIDTVLAAMPAKVAEYKKGKKGLIGLFMGEVKKLSKGKADPKATTAMLEEKLR